MADLLCSSAEAKQPETEIQEDIEDFFMSFDLFAHRPADKRALTL